MGRVLTGSKWIYHFQSSNSLVPVMPKLVPIILIGTIILASSFLIEHLLLLFFFFKIKTLCLKELPVKLVKTPPLLHPHMLLLCVTRSSPFHLPGVPGRDLISMSGLLCFCVEETQLLGPLSLELVCRK